MKEPNVQLKNVKYFTGMEGQGFNAVAYINGVKCLIIIDDAQGGCYTYRMYGFTDEIKQNVQLLDEYIYSLPDITNVFGETTITIRPDRDIYFSEKLTQQEQEKENRKKLKKIEKQCNTAIVFGKPNDNFYQYLNFKQPLSDINPAILQLRVQEIQKKYCKDGVVIFNNNLKSLGVKY